MGTGEIRTGDPGAASPGADLGYSVPEGGGDFMPDFSGMDSAYAIDPNMFGPNPDINASGNMFGGGFSIDDVMSVQNPNMTQFFLGGLGFETANRDRIRDLLLGRMSSYTQLGTAGIGAGAQMYGSNLQHQAAMENARIQDMIAQARFGSGGLESRALENQMAIARMPWEFKESVLGTPLVQQILSGGGAVGLGGAGGPSIGLGGMGGASMDGGMAEQELARQELAASGRRAANEASQVMGDVETATGPGMGMAVGPSQQVASNRAALMRMQTAAGEREAARLRSQQAALASRGQSLGFVGGLFG